MMNIDTSQTSYWFIKPVADQNNQIEEEDNYNNENENDKWSYDKG